MKKLLMVVLLCSSTGAKASSYIRSPLWGGPTVHYAGVYIDPRDPGKTTVGSEVALLTHDPKDGCLLPGVVCEQWAPIATGLSVTGGRVYWDIGPTVNVFPWMVVLANKAGLNTSIVAPSDSKLSFAFGPKLGLNPVSDGQLQPFSQWGPKLLLMTAAQLRW